VYLGWLLGSCYAVTMVFTRVFWVVARELLCSYYVGHLGILGGCAGVAMQYGQQGFAMQLQSYDVLGDYYFGLLLGRCCVFNMAS